MLNGSNGKDGLGDDVVFNDSGFLAFKELFWAELGDKTFTLVFLFTFMWTNIKQSTWIKQQIK